MLLIFADAVRDDQFTSERSSAKSNNPTYVGTEVHEHGRSAIQPHYICDDDSSRSSMPLSSWHYSCKLACSDRGNRQNINIIHAVWNYVGRTIKVYKMTTTRVCYTSHMNVWGSCSQAQSITPVPTEPSDFATLPDDYLKSRGHPIYGTKSFINSREADCSYFSDNVVCGRDYKVTYKEGKLSQKSEEESVMLSIYEDGIRTSPKLGYLQQNDAAWMWIPPEDQEYPCGWTTGADISCELSDNGEAMRCNGIGYTYNIQAMSIHTTCLGDIYDIHGPAPFIYKEKAKGENREALFDKASQGKPDVDINLIKCVNKAFTDIEENYCSSICDLYARHVSADDDHVLDTPIGTWRLSLKDPLNPMLIPCKPTASWRIKNPATICYSSNSIIVEEPITGHVNRWDPKRDYIVLGDMCSTEVSRMLYQQDNIYDKVKSGENFSISFWTGDKLTFSAPYNKPIWENDSKLFRRNPSWFSKVELEKDMIRTPREISEILTYLVSNITDEVAYKPKSTTSIKNFLFNEIFCGISSVVSSAWDYMIGIFGSITKIIVLLFIIILIILLLKIAWYLKQIFSGPIKEEGPVYPKHEMKNIRFELPEGEEFFDASSTSFKVDPSDRTSKRHSVRQAKRNLKLLTIE